MAHELITPLRILAITPGTGFDANAWKRVLGSGVDGFMLREPGLEAGALFEAARWCRTHHPAIRLWVNGRLEVALAVGCGLHAPEAHPGIPPGLVPLSRPLHAEGQLQARLAAEQLLVAPIFEVPGKGTPWGPRRLHAFLDGVPGPAPEIFALGGIAVDRMQALRHPRLAGVALIRALWEAPEPGRLVTELREAWTA